MKCDLKAIMKISEHKDFLKKDLLGSRLIWENDHKYLFFSLLEYTLKWQQIKKGIHP